MSVLPCLHVAAQSDRTKFLHSRACLQSYVRTNVTNNLIDTMQDTSLSSHTLQACRQATKQQGAELATQKQTLESLQQEREAQQHDPQAVVQLQQDNRKLQEQLREARTRRSTVEDGSTSRGPTDDVSSQPTGSPQVLTGLLTTWGL